MLQRRVRARVERKEAVVASPNDHNSMLSLSLAFSLTASKQEQLLWSHVSSTQGLSREHQGDSGLYVQEELLSWSHYKGKGRGGVVDCEGGSAQERDVTKARSSACWLWHSCTPTTYETHTADFDLYPRLPLLHL